MAKTDTKKEDEKQYDTQKDKISPLEVGKEAAVRTNERGVLNMAERLMKKPKYYAEGGETKSSRTKLLEEQPKNFMQEMATKVSKGLDKIGITQEKEYKGKTKEEVAVKKAKGGKVKRYAEGGVSEDYRKEKQKEIAARQAEREAADKANRDKIAKATYDREVKKYEAERMHNKPGTASGAIDKFLDKAGDKVRSVGKFFGTNRMTSQDDEAKMQARKDVKGYKKGGSIDGCAIRGKTRASHK